MDISIIGTGYVGLVTGTCLAEIGHRVVCVDNDEEKIAVLKSGGIPIYEPGLEDLVKRNTAKGRLSFTSRLEEGVERGTVVFICVGTPPLEDGEADLSAVERVTRKIAEAANSYKLIVEKSTVPVQTGMWIEKTIKIYNNRQNAEFDVASNPEFLREGTAVLDFLHPDRIVVGVTNDRAERLLRELYAPIIERSFVCPIHSPPSASGGCPSSEPVPFLVTDIQSAELIKHASNSFLAMKISFINAISDLCDKVGADVTKVAEGIGLDKRIGASHLNAGIGFGGFCFPKDLQAFVRIAEKSGCDFSLLREVERINNSRIDVVVNKLKAHLWILKEKTVGVLGLAFKPNTDDIRFAPSLEIIKRLQREGVNIKAYDPKAMEKAKRELEGVTFCNDPYAVAEGCEALIIATEWREFKTLDMARIKTLMRRPFILDGRNIYNREELVRLRQMGFEYVGMGR
ncbi:MAG: UDP-glucose/GDP-mannose dehydrogenase family protein [candidate division NC10 bacterium]|nr:UDP-glucose/GDP-mannose dehydrogenase family protein [candidate division NC10 bacterium]